MIFKEHPDSTGSLGIAISEAVEVAAQDDQTKYALGSVLNHVLLHQTVLVRRHWHSWNRQVSILTLWWAAGGGSNFAGIAFLHGCQPARRAGAS